MKVTLKYDLLTVFVGLSFEIGFGNQWGEGWNRTAMPRLDVHLHKTNMAALEHGCSCGGSDEQIRS